MQVNFCAFVKSGFVSCICVADKESSIYIGSVGATAPFIFEHVGIFIDVNVRFVAVIVTVVLGAIDPLENMMMLPSVPRLDQVVLKIENPFTVYVDPDMPPESPSAALTTVNEPLATINPLLTVDGPEGCAEFMTNAP
jgi:hypothetical protein